MPTTTLAPSVTTRDDKGLKFISIVETRYNKSHLSEEEAQCINNAPGLADLIGNFIEENRRPNKYANEEVQSKYGYLSGYRKPISITDQIDILRSHWPTLNPDSALRFMREVYGTLQFPEWIEGPFAIIRPGFFSDKYGEELEEIFKALVKDRKGKFQNYWEGQLGLEYLQQTEPTLGKLAMLMEQQPGSDILITAAQFGIRHRGRSVRRACEVLIGSEFGLGAKDNGTMILTNPIRIQHVDDLWIDCSGDRFSPEADGGFACAPCFGFSDGRLRFRVSGVAGAHDSYGSSSASLPQ